MTNEVTAASTDCHCTWDLQHKLKKAYLEMSKHRDLAMPHFEDIDKCLSIMVHLDKPIKELFVRVTRNPKQMRNAPAPVVRFVHESMDFLINGSKRSINIEEWQKVLADVLDDHDGKQRLTPHGREWTWSNRNGSAMTLFQPHESAVDPSEISNCSLLHKWLCREQGLKDALIAYQLLGRISADY